MKKNKVKKFLLWSLAAIVVVAVSVFTTKFMSYLKIRETQAQAGQTIPKDFIKTVPYTKEDGGRFMLEAEASNGVKGLFYIDTHANSMMREDSLRRGDATSWGYWPLEVHNYYGQSFREELFRMPHINIAGAKVDNTLWSVTNREDSVYAIMNHPVIGKDILQLMCWDFDTDNGNVTISSIYNSQSIKEKMKDYTFYEDGIHFEQIPINFPGTKATDKFIFDLGYGDNYLEVDKKIFDELKKTYTPEVDTLKTCISYTFPKVKIELAGSEITIPVISYNKRSANMIGAKLMEYYNFCIFSHRDKEDDEPKVDLYLKRNNKK